MTDVAAPDASLTAIVADDEPLVRLHLRRMLEQQGIGVLGEADDATSVLQMTEALHPDVLFLDIQMPLLSGMQTASALECIDRPPLVVFVTGYSEHAAEAFDHGALDYLLKPVSAERLARTLTRARQRLAAERSLRNEAADEVRQRPAAPLLQPLRRIPVRTDYAVRLIRIEEVRYAAARQKAVFLHTTTSEAPLRTYFTLTQLDALLPPETFVRIHDSYIVNLDAVEELSFLGNHTYSVRMLDGESLPVGRTRYASFRERLGLDRSG
jgi:DNA-binding LytR/AlgR family response regulator